MKRLEFLMTQRDDLVAAPSRSSSGTRDRQTRRRCSSTRSAKVRENFRTVFQTLFAAANATCARERGRAARERDRDPRAPPQAHAAIHLLSSGNGRSSPCRSCRDFPHSRVLLLLDEWTRRSECQRGPLLRLLAEFKDLTQFIVITTTPAPCSATRCTGHHAGARVSTIVACASVRWSRSNWTCHRRLPDGRAWPPASACHW